MEGDPTLLAVVDISGFGLQKIYTLCGVPVLLMEKMLVKQVGAFGTGMTSLTDGDLRGGRMMTHVE